MTEPTAPLPEDAAWLQLGLDHLARLEPYPWSEDPHTLGTPLAPEAS